MENTISDAEKQYAMFIHISQFAGVIIPGLGWILPLVLWLTRKDTSSYIDANGKIVMNWIISCFLYAIGASILIFILIGIPLLIALGVCSLVFTIIGAIRANEGIIWAYPLSIKFIN